MAQGTQRNTQDETAEIRRLEGEVARAEKKADDAEKELDIHKEKMQDMQIALRTSADQLTGVAAALKRVNHDYKEAKERRIDLEKQQSSVKQQASRRESVSSRRNSEVTAPEQPAQRRQSKVGIQRRPSNAGRGQEDLENVNIEERGNRLIEELQKECNAASNMTNAKLFRKTSEPNEKAKKKSVAAKEPPGPKGKSKNEERIWVLTKAVNQAETRLANAQEDRAKLDIKKFQKSLENIQAKIQKAKAEIKFINGEKAKELKQCNELESALRQVESDSSGPPSVRNRIPRGNNREEVEWELIQEEISENLKQQQQIDEEDYKRQLEQLEETQEPTLPLYLLSERQTEMNRTRTVVQRLVGAINNNLINIEEGELAENWKGLKSRAEKLEEKLNSLRIEDTPATNGSVDEKESGRHEFTTEEASRNNMKTLLITFKELQDTIHTMHSVQQHFSLLIATGQYHEVLRELEDTEISNDEPVSLETMRKELIRILDEQLRKEEKELKSSQFDIDNYISEWKAMEFKRAKKRQDIPEDHRMNAENSQDENIRGWIDKTAEEMKIAMRGDKRKRFIHTSLGRQLESELNRAFSINKELVNQTIEQLNIEKCTNTILDYLAGSIDKSELGVDLSQYDIGFKEYKTLNKLLIDQASSTLNKGRSENECRKMVIATGSKLDAERSELLGRALITSDSDLIKKHKEQLEREIKTIISEAKSNSNVLPQLVSVRIELNRQTQVYPYFLEKTGEKISKLKDLLWLIEGNSGSLFIEPDNPIEDNFKACFDELGEMGLIALVIGELKSALDIKEFNLIYSKDGQENADGFNSVREFPFEYRDTEPYFSPNGWRRRALDLGLSKNEFKEKFGNWPILYHGTKDQFVGAILLNGLRTSIGPQCYLGDGEVGLYASPSIEYSGNPIYAERTRLKENGMWMQVVFQVRIDPHLLAGVHPGTIKGAFPALPSTGQRCDPNFSNEELEWLVKPRPGRLNRYIRAADGIVVSGLMMRITKDDPCNLPQCAWWNFENTGSKANASLPSSEYQTQTLPSIQEEAPPNRDVGGAPPEYPQPQIGYGQQPYPYPYGYPSYAPQPYAPSQHQVIVVKGNRAYAASSVNSSIIHASSTAFYGAVQPHQAPGVQVIPVQPNQASGVQVIQVRPQAPSLPPKPPNTSTSCTIS